MTDPDPDLALTGAERRSLRRIAALMIPASAAHDVPGADDDAIFADILASLGRDAGLVQRAMRRLDALAGGAFADLPASEQATVAARFRDEGGAPLLALNRVIPQCYYRDDRVVRSLGLEARAPFPKGFDVEPGDWSLLDPVRARPKFYRSVP